MNNSVSSLGKNWQRRLGGLLGLALPAVIILALVSCLGKSLEADQRAENLAPEKSGTKVAAIRKIIQLK